MTDQRLHLTDPADLEPADRRRDHALRQRVADVLASVSGLEMQEALAEITACCSCGDVAVGRCESCGAFCCDDMIGCSDPGEPMTCWRCAKGRE